MKTAIMATAVIWVLFVYYGYTWWNDHRWLVLSKRFRRYAVDDSILNHWYLLLTMFVISVGLTAYLWIYVV